MAKKKTVIERSLPIEIDKGYFENFYISDTVLGKRRMMKFETSSDSEVKENNNRV